MQAFDNFWNYVKQVILVLFAGSDIFVKQLHSLSYGTKLMHCLRHTLYLYYQQMVRIHCNWRPLLQTRRCVSIYAVLLPPFASTVAFVFFYSFFVLPDLTLMKPRNSTFFRLFSVFFTQFSIVSILCTIQTFKFTLKLRLLTFDSILHFSPQPFVFLAPSSIESASNKAFHTLRRYNI